MASLARRLAIAMLVLLASVTAVGAHQDPPGCFAVGAAISVQALRADGVTNVAAGSVEDCESLFYRVTLSVPGSPGVCAFSAGTLELTTPDGVVHTLVDPVPCLGGTTGACTPGLTQVVSALVPYTAVAADVAGGFLQATADYSGGVAHDSVGDTTPLSANVPKFDTAVACSSEPTNKCASLKLTAASKYLLARAKCYAKAAKLGVPVDPICLRKAQAALIKKFLAAEKLGICITSGDAADILGDDQACIEDLLTSLVSPP